MGSNILLPDKMNMISGKTLVVTGATGLIGRVLVRRLLAAGARVISCSTRKPVPALAEDDAALEHHIGDLRERNLAKRLMIDADGVFHLAGRRASVGLQRKRGATMLADNTMICFNTIQAAMEAGVKRFCYTSTVTVYPPLEHYIEDLAWSANPHPAAEFVAWSKRMAEKLLEASAIEYGADRSAVVRLVNTFGPHDDFNPETALVVPALIHRTLCGENPLVVWGDGSAVRDFLFVDDAVSGILLAYEKGIGKGPINIGSGVGYAIREVVKVITNATNCSPAIHWDTSKPSGEPRKVLDISKAKSVLGFEPTVSFEEAVERTVAWYRQYGAIVRV